MGFFQYTCQLQRDLGGGAVKGRSKFEKKKLP